MASIQLDGVWVHDFSDFSDYVVLLYASGLQRQRSTDTDVQKLAGGRLRAVRRAGTKDTWDLSAAALDRDQVAWLEARAGQTVMVRESRGNILFAVFPDVTVDEHDYDAEADVSVTLQEVTASAAV